MPLLKQWVLRLTKIAAAAYMHFPALRGGDISSLTREFAPVAGKAPLRATGNSPAIGRDEILPGFGICEE